MRIYVGDRDRGRDTGPGLGGKRRASERRRSGLFRSRRHQGTSLAFADRNNKRCNTYLGAAVSEMISAPPRPPKGGKIESRTDTLSCSLVFERWYSSDRNIYTRQDIYMTIFPPDTDCGSSRDRMSGHIYFGLVSCSSTPTLRYTRRHTSLPWKLFPAGPWTGRGSLVLVPDHHDLFNAMTVGS